MSKEQLSQVAQNVAEFLGIVLIAAISVFFNRIKKALQEKKARKFDLVINKSARTQALLSEIRALVDASRIKLFQLHNGEYFLSGESSMKCSMTHFYVKTGIAVPNHTQSQNIPTSHFANLFKCMRDNGYCHFQSPLTEGMDDHIDPAFRRMMSLNGARQAVIVPLLKKKDIWLGFIVVSWMDSDTEITEEMKQHILDYAQQITDQLG